MDMLIMTPEMKKLLKMAIADKEFCDLVKRAMPLLKVPNIYSIGGEAERFTYLYAGYYIGKQNKD
jgi:hypothetical protein